MKKKFKETSQASYEMFREVMQIIDSITLDIQHYRYKPRALVASILYLILGLHYEQFSQIAISETFSTPYGLNEYFRNLEDPNLFNQLFSQYLYLAFGFVFEEIFPTIQYVSSFFQIPFDYSIPSSANSLKVRKSSFLISFSESGSF